MFATLDDTDIIWAPFIDEDAPIEWPAIDLALLELSDDEVRDYCRSLRADREYLAEAYHVAVTQLAHLTQRLEQVREWNATLIAAARLFPRDPD